MNKYSQSQIDEMGKKGRAFGPDADGHFSYPIADHEDVKNAVHAVGRGNADHQMIRRFIMKRADAIGASHLIPDTWNSDGSLARKARWNSERRSGGIEKRAKYAGHTEVRQFRIGMNNGPVSRAATGGNSTAITITGSPVVYSPTVYFVHDSYGSFTESIQSGAVTPALASSDTKFKYDHAGLVMAHVSSGTLVITDSATSLNCTATLDPRQMVAADLALAIGRGDVSQMSVSFSVAPGGDEWSDDYSNRRITRLQAFYDVSAVGDPASPTTSVELLEFPGFLEPLAGPDGTQNAPDPSPASAQDGTGTRTSLLLELEMMELQRPGSKRVGSRASLKRDLIEAHKVGRGR